jgi:hypothetical protein
MISSGRLTRAPLLRAEKERARGRVGGLHGVKGNPVDAPSAHLLEDVAAEHPPPLKIDVAGKAAAPRWLLAGCGLLVTPTDGAAGVPVDVGGAEEFTRLQAWDKGSSTWRSEASQVPEVSPRWHIHLTETSVPKSSQ